MKPSQLISAKTLKIYLNKPNAKGNPRTCYSCVFYQERANNCTAEKYTKDPEVINGCFNTNKVWHRAEGFQPLESLYKED